MMHYDSILKAYADNGLRSAAEWLTLGREIQDGAEPRAVTTHLREPLSLYSRGQTRVRPSTRHSRPRPTPATAGTAPKADTTVQTEVAQ